jgi:multiple antibiotic resistance protein
VQLWSAVLWEQTFEPIGIDVNSFAGAFVLFFLALVRNDLGICLYKDGRSKSASIVPIVFPLIAGAEQWRLYFFTSYYQAINIIIAIVLNIILVLSF